MRVVITGGAGYIGSTVTAALIASGLDVCVFDKLIYGSESLLAFASHPRFRLIVGDVRDTDQLAKAMEGANAVVHLAAVVGELACEVDERAAWSINVEGVGSALQASRKASVEKLLLVSTCSNYGIADTLATEETILNPLTLYAKSKVEAENLVRRASTDACVFRFGTICGLSPRMRFDLLVNDLARSAATGRLIEMFSLEAWRPMLDVKDAARAVATWLRAAPSDYKSRLFNVVSQNVRKRDLIDMVRRHYPDVPIEIATRKLDARDYRVSGDRIRAELGYEPEVTVEDALISVAQAVREGVFQDPFWAGHSAVPLERRKLSAPPSGDRELATIAGRSLC